jgi:hypothetical protein
MSDLGISPVETLVAGSETPQQCLQQKSSYAVVGTAKGRAGFLRVHHSNTPLWSLLLTSGGQTETASPRHDFIEADDALLHKPWPP